MYVTEGKSLDVFKGEIARDFSIWFPPQAWGKQNFLIEFSSGPAVIKISRRQVKDELIDKVTVTFSTYITEFYDNLRSTVLEITQLRKNPDSAEVDPRRDVEITIAVRESGIRKMMLDFKDDFIGYQLFVPAGRAFFTSTSKGFAAVEQGLDPITGRFSRLFARLRDRPVVNMSRLPKEWGERRLFLMEKFFGGQLRLGSNADIVETRDGRKLPFGILSSGQQELLPLWLALDYFNGLQRNGMIYIEEPEAHLFPSAQSMLTEYLARLVKGEKRRTMLITTHSPYLLAKLNNLMKAGKLGMGSDEAIAKRVKEVLPADTWLGPGSTAAYAIRDGNVSVIIDDSGMIDGDYLDEISNEMSREYSSLLAIESGYED